MSEHVGRSATRWLPLHRHHGRKPQGLGRGLHTHLHLDLHLLISIRIGDSRCNVPEGGAGAESVRVRLHLGVRGGGPLRNRRSASHADGNGITGRADTC
jgi:hypothetical protein